MTWGTACGVISALAYTGANILLKLLSQEGVDPVWVSCVKAAPTAALAWWMIARRARRGLPALPPARLLPGLLAAGLFMQLGGNVSFQWALGEIGLAVCIPLVFGTLIIGGALLGRIWLGESISHRSALAMLLLVAAVTVLSFGTQDARDAVSPSADNSGLTTVVLATAAACLAGLAYAVCNTVIRRVATGAVSLSATLMVLSTSGVVSLGVLALARIGPGGCLQTTAAQWGVMLAAGLFNAAAFFSLGLALQTVTIVRANTINASQVAMCAVAGLILFGEPATASLGIGIALTMAGLLIVTRARKTPSTDRQETREPKTPLSVMPDET